MRPVQYAYRNLDAVAAVLDGVNRPEPPLQRRGKRPGNSKYTIDVVTVSGRTAFVEFRIQFDWVEIWHHEERTGFFQREGLSNWLASPGAALVSDDVRLSVDWMVDASGRVALSLPDVSLWTLSPHDLDSLRSRL